MLKRIGLFSLFFSLVFNCTITEKPEFIGLDKIEVVNSDLNLITLSAEAMFNNLNDVGGTLKTDDFKVYINETVVASIISEEFDVPSKQSFRIPLIVSVATDSLLDKKSLGSLLGSLVSQQLRVRYKGEIDYKVLGYSSTYAIDELQTIKIKL